MTGEDGDPARRSDLPPGHDEADPYGDGDLSEYPDWWRESVETFREAGLRPYRPSRLADGVAAQELAAELEAEYGVTVRFRSVDPHEDPSWELVVDGESVAEFDHVRDPRGFTRYGIGADRVRERVAGAAEDDG
jgi:hypothetical protein